MNTTVKMNEWISKGFNLYTKECMGPLLLMALVTLLLTLFTFGILAGPLSAGFALACLRAARGERNLPINDLFKGFDFFLQSFLLVLVWGVIAFVVSAVLAFIPCVGQIASIIVSYALTTVIMFALFLIVDKKMEFWPASMMAIEAIKANAVQFIAFGFIASLIGSVGAILCGIGIILSLPAAYTIFAVAYQDVFAEGGDSIPVEATEAAASDTPSTDGMAPANS